jgi:hypothetical protein
MNVGSGTGSHARMALVSLLVSVAVFAGCFAIGRAQRPAPAPAERLAPGVPGAAAGTAIPLALSSAPALATEAARVSTPPARASSERVAANGAGTAATSAAATSPASVAPAARTRAPVGKRQAAGTSGGTSFDSSG